VSRVVVLFNVNHLKSLPIRKGIEKLRKLILKQQTYRHRFYKEAACALKWQER